MTFIPISSKMLELYEGLGAIQGLSSYEILMKAAVICGESDFMGVKKEPRRK